MLSPGFHFANPGYLYLLLLVPLLGFWYLRFGSRASSRLSYSSLRPFAGLRPTLKERLRPLTFLLRILVVALLVLALARPRSTASGENIHTEGIDIALLLDISGSMLAEDFHPNRIEAAKQVAQDFIDGRRNDRIGLVIFSGQSFTQCPLTTDFRVLKNLLRQVRTGMIEDGTAIGLAIAQGVNRLKDSPAKSKVMILLTDGVNNRGEIDPVTASQIAQSFGIRIYTIAVGTMGEAPYPVPTPYGVRYQNLPAEVDEKVLQTIAGNTHGQFFRATDGKSLKRIFAAIDQLEKTRIEVMAYKTYTELFYPLAWLALALLLAEFLLSHTLLRKLP